MKHSHACGTQRERGWDLQHAVQLAWCSSLTRAHCCRALLLLFGAACLVVNAPPVSALQELASGATLAGVKQLLASALPGWLPEFARLLSKPLSAEAREGLIFCFRLGIQGSSCRNDALLRAGEANADSSRPMDGLLIFHAPPPHR